MKLYSLSSETHAEKLSAAPPECRISPVHLSLSCQRSSSGKPSGNILNSNLTSSSLHSVVGDNDGDDDNVGAPEADGELDGFEEVDGELEVDETLIGED